MPGTSSIAEIAEWLFVNRAPNLPPEGLADVFDRLIWCLEDNGHELLVTVRDVWLQDDDEDKVTIALAMEETFPFNGGEPMDAAFGRICERWPHLARRCDEIRANWRRTMRLDS